MLREEEKDQGSSLRLKTFSRSVSWTERPPRKSNANPQWNNKARACLPPLQPLSIVRPSIEEWPRAGSDDLGVWPNPPTPGARPGSKTPRENSCSDLPPREFECRKDKLAFFDKECSRILDHIYLGSDVIAKNREILRQRGITHVLNCVGFACPEYFSNELMYKTLWLQDSPSEDIISILYDVFDYFEDVRVQGGRVLVHCCHGVSRSTSLVIAYLMWKEGQSFDDAFQHVKTARGVTNPNVGFACQLLQCEKRVHALPASPSSVLRMYYMAPHSPYDPLHLVPKMLCEPGADRLDSRGSFIVHIPSALYIWMGKHCSPVMSNDARTTASQIIRYEQAKGPAIIIIEDEETFEFWNTFSHNKGLAEGCRLKSEKEKGLSAEFDTVPATVVPCLNQRKLDEYNLDFEIFHTALAGGVVPPCPSSEAGSETCLPSRENGWNTLRRKFADGIMKDIVILSKSDSGVAEGCDKLETTDVCSVKDNVSPADLSRPSSNQIDSQNSFAPCVSSSLGDDASLLESPSFNLVDSFSSFFVSKPKSNSTSPSISPSTSDYSSSFSFSPSSSNWSDLSFISAQPSPRTFEPSDTDPIESGPVEECLHCAVESTCLRDNSISSQSGEATSFCHVSRAAGLCSTSGQSSPSLAERRGSSLPPRMILPSIDEESYTSENLPRYSEDDVVKDVECKNPCPDITLEIAGKEPISDVTSRVAGGEFLTTSPDEKKA